MARKAGRSAILLCSFRTKLKLNRERVARTWLADLRTFLAPWSALIALVDVSHNRNEQQKIENTLILRFRHKPQPVLDLPELPISLMPLADLASNMQNARCGSSEMCVPTGSCAPRRGRQVKNSVEMYYTSNQEHALYAGNKEPIHPAHSRFEDIFV